MKNPILAIVKLCVPNTLNDPVLLEILREWGEVRNMVETNFMSTVPVLKI